jgi:hypothetical protein
VGSSPAAPTTFEECSKKSKPGQFSDSRLYLQTDSQEAMSAMNAKHVARVYRKHKAEQELKKLLKIAKYRKN